MVTSLRLVPPGALLESWAIWILPFIILLAAGAGAVGGGVAFARAKERLVQRLVLGAFAGALTGWYVLDRQVVGTTTSFVFCSLVGGYIGADGISILLKAIGRWK